MKLGIRVIISGLSHNTMPRGNGPRKTLAAVLTKLKAPLELLELDIPELQPGQVLVRVKLAGLCRTQLSEAMGLKGEDKYLPHLLGHEAVGEVVDIGAKVKTVKPNDIVVMSWIKGKGMDVPGGTFYHQGKKINAGGVAVFTQYAVVAENRVTKISKTVPWDVASLLGCAVATGAGIVKNTLQVKPKSSIAIYGIGGVGGMALLMAKALTCNPLIAIDVQPGKLAWAKKLGATHTINAVTEDVGKVVAEIVPGGVDYAVEATGIPAVMEQAFGSLSNKGVLAIAGHPEPGKTMRIDPFELIKGKRVVGTWGGGTNPDVDIPYYVKLHKAGKLPIEKLISHRFALKDINQSMQVLAKGEAGRILIDCA